MDGTSGASSPFSISKFYKAQPASRSFATLLAVIGVAAAIIAVIAASSSAPTFGLSMSVAVPLAILAVALIVTALVCSAPRKNKEVLDNKAVRLSRVEKKI